MAHQASLEEIDQELTLYDPAGPWRLFEARLRKHEARAVSALETGPIEDIPAKREVLSLIRDLLATPERLRTTRALLTEGGDNE